MEASVSIDRERQGSPVGWVGSLIGSQFDFPGERQAGQVLGGPQVSDRRPGCRKLFGVKLVSGEHRGQQPTESVELIRP